MPHPFSCPHCAQPLGVEHRLLGSEVACPHCYQTFFPEVAPPPTEMRKFGCPACGQPFQAAWPPEAPQVVCPSCRQAVRLTMPTGPGPGQERAPQIVTETPTIEIKAAAPVGPAIVLPTEDGGQVTVHEPVKTVRKGTQTIVLRKLSPEEKRRRRAITNAVWFVVGAILLAVTVMVLGRFAV